MDIEIIARLDIPHSDTITSTKELMLWEEGAANALRRLWGKDVVVEARDGTTLIYERVERKPLAELMKEVD